MTHFTGHVTHSFSKAQFTDISIYLFKTIYNDGFLSIFSIRFPAYLFSEPAISFSFLLPPFFCLFLLPPPLSSFHLFSFFKFPYLGAWKIFWILLKKQNLCPPSWTLLNSTPDPPTLLTVYKWCWWWVYRWIQRNNLEKQTTQIQGGMRVGGRAKIYPFVSGKSNRKFGSLKTYRQGKIVGKISSQWSTQKWRLS